jgi:6-phosphofructokinase 1
MLFCVGGDGTQRGAHAICEELRKRHLEKVVVGIPKTIDNDIPFVQMSFGYATALEKAAEVIRGAHVEARGAPNGIAVVKLMGRDSGFIAAGAALVSHETDYVLVPEVPFPLEGESGFLATLERRMLGREHAVIVVAEGAGQHLFESAERRRDESGNVLHEDIGLFLTDRIRDHFAKRDIPINLKYLDPSYLIRSIPANAWDCFLSEQMARSAVHAAMAGKTDLMIGFWHHALIHVPIEVVVAERRRHLDPDGDLWTAVLSATSQPDW